MTQSPPETFEAHGHTWTKHTPGDPMPCDGESRIYVLMRDPSSGSMGRQETTAAGLDWDIIERAKKVEIIGWRYADKPESPEPSELDKLRQIVADCMAVMPVGNLRTHTRENLAGRIGGMAKELAEESLENDHFRSLVSNLESQLASAKRDQEIALELREAMKEEVEQLRRWKTEQMAVESSWDEQAVAKLLGLTLGQSIRPQIQSAIDRLMKERDEARKDAERLASCLSSMAARFCECDQPDCRDCELVHNAKSFLKEHEALTKTEN